MILEFDKKGAEWVVVAYLAGDARMIDIIESGKRPHLETGHFITGANRGTIEWEDKLLGHSTDPEFIKNARNENSYFLGLKHLPRNMTIYQMGKKANHGLNYRQTHVGFSETYEMTQAEAKPIVSAYSEEIYTSLPGWWTSIEEELRSQKRALYNCAPFRRKRYFMEQWGSHMVREAIAYKPQSTVADITLSAMRQIYNDKSSLMEPVDLLAQVHDSIVIQYLSDDLPRLAEACRRIIEYLDPVLTTEQGREFRIETELKIGRDWSHASMKEIDIVEDDKVFLENIRSVFDA